MTPAEAAALVARMQAVVQHRVKWEYLYASLLVDDPEALAFVREKLDPVAIRMAQRQRAAQARRERAEEAYEGQGLDLEALVHRGPAYLDRVARGRLVWLYHGTTSRFLPQIRRAGLVGGANWIDAQVPGVYLTAKPGRGDPGGTAAFYAARAAGHFGGRPVVLRVLVDYDSLAWDADDADLSVGNYQWVTGYVPPERICEANGARIRGHCRS